MDAETKDKFRIDGGSSDEHTLYVDVKDRGTVAIHRTDEGIVVDVFPFVVVDQPVASTWADLGMLFPQGDN